MSQLVTRSTVIAVFLCLWGSVILQGAGVIAQETHEPDTPVVETEAAGPAETGYLFFPRSAAADSAADAKETADAGETGASAGADAKPKTTVRKALQRKPKTKRPDAAPAEGEASASSSAAEEPASLPETEEHPE